MNNSSRKKRNNSCSCVGTCTLVFRFNDLDSVGQNGIGIKFFLGCLASGMVPSQPQSEQTWRQMYTHRHTPWKTPQHTRIQILYHRIPSNVHSHMHKPAHKHTHYATHSQTLSVCVWNESRVVRKTAWLKKKEKKGPALPQGQTSLSHAIQRPLLSHCRFYSPPPPYLSPSLSKD